MLQKTKKIKMLHKALINFPVLTTERLTLRQLSEIDVQEIFPTLQGEGPFVGYPSVFIRLGGCNLACDFCDTEFDSYKNFSLEKIIIDVSFWEYMGYPSL